MNGMNLGRIVLNLEEGTKRPFPLSNRHCRSCQCDSLQPMVQFFLRYH